MSLRNIISIVFGNIILFLVLTTLQFFFNLKASIWNTIGASFLFFTITLYALQKAKKSSLNQTTNKMMFLTSGMALIRIVASLIWVILLKEVNGEVTLWELISFITIYAFYLFIDVYYLDRLLRRSLQY
ncbi:MAG: hypothetical protein V3V00_14730 [Saprospiraceae bacterium]